MEFMLIDLLHKMRMLLRFIFQRFVVWLLASSIEQNVEEVETFITSCAAN